MGHRTTVFIEESNHFECLRYLYENGFPITCMYIALAGNLKALQYAHEHGSEWNIWTCEYAANAGNLECLRYGCPWDERTCHNAAYVNEL
jgi:hypothetical protein